MKRTMLIGGSGFIGMGLLPRLKASGRQALIVDKYIDKHKDYLGFETVEADSADIKTLTPLLNNCDELVYLAFNSTPAAASQSQEEEYQKNIKPVEQILKNGAVKKLEKIIYISSGGAIYGNSSSAPIKEQAPTQPISEYGKSKLKIEQMCLHYFHQYDIPIAILRPSNAYGPGQIPYRGQGFIATLMASALMAKPITIYGEDVVRDYLYIDDLSKGIVSALDHSKPGEIYNIGSSIGVSNQELTAKIEEIIRKDGFSIDLNRNQKREFDPAYNVLDISKLQNISAWQPEINLNRGLQLSWNWIKKTYGQ